MFQSEKRDREAKEEERKPDQDRTARKHCCEG